LCDFKEYKIKQGDATEIEEVKLIKKVNDDLKYVTVLCKCGKHYFEVDPDDPPVTYYPHSRMTYYPCETGESTSCSMLRSQEFPPGILMKLMNRCCNCGEFNKIGDILYCDHFFCIECKKNNNLRIGKHYVTWCRICWRSIPYNAMI